MVIGWSGAESGWSLVGVGWALFLLKNDDPLVFFLTFPAGRLSKINNSIMRLCKSGGSVDVKFAKLALKMSIKFEI